jgi:hypothetical protein
MTNLKRSRCLLLAALSTLVVIIAIVAQPASAQYFGALDSLSPLAWYPGVEGQVTARLTWVQIGSGSVSGFEGGSLRDTFHLNENELFLDSMARFQVSRLSIRTIYEPRDVAGYRLGFGTEARLTYSGFRLGGDLDIIQCNKTRFGLDMDYDFYSPRFVYPTNVSSFPHAINGTNALTMGVHAIYNPLETIFGMSGIVAARFRCPITGTQVTDWEFSGGIASPASLMGSWSFTAGYRNTQLSFSTGGEPEIKFDCVFQGWFGELAFYY